MAKRRLLEGFQYIGITNRYSESVCLFNIKFDGKCKQIMFKNVNPANSHPMAFNFSTEDMAFLKTYQDSIDDELYHFANSIFEKELQKYGVTKEFCASQGCWPDEH